MKLSHKDRLMLVFSILFLFFVILIFINGIVINDDSEIHVSNDRPEIALLLGEDKVTDNPFYENAEKYFRLNPENKADHLLTDLRSLNSIIHYLNEGYSRTGQPYGNVHMVFHSNPWAGMNISIEDDGPRIDVELLEEAIVNKRIEAIHPGAIDSNTTFHLYACGIGNNEILVGLLKQCFGNSNISAPTGYVNFHNTNGQYHQSEMEVYYAFFPTAYKPADLHLLRQLKGRYPDTEIDWMYYIKNSHYQYNIPIEWEIIYPEYEMPELANDEDKMEWLLNQDELMELVEKTEIPFDDFRWIIKKKENAIKVYGKVTVFCILKNLDA